MSTIKRLTTEELTAGLEYIRRSPKDNGMLELIARRPEVGEREALKGWSAIIGVRAAVHACQMDRLIPRCKSTS